MGIDFDNFDAFDALAETVKWRQDKSPHLEGSFKANVLHGESQAENAGPTRGPVAADPWTVIVGSIPAACAGITAGDTLELKNGTTLYVQQITKDQLGWVIRCTASMRAPK